MIKKYRFLKLSPNTTNNFLHKIPLKRVILLITLTLFITLISFIFIINSYLNKINKIDISKNDLNVQDNFSRPSDKNTTLNAEENTIKPNTDVKNIALFGIDEAEGVAGRSDCIMILTIDNKHNKLKLSSIIRDSYVTIPTKDKKDKINHAYAFGGPKLALETLNKNFNLDADKFITVNFSSLPKIIDDIGGITLNITDEELNYINQYINNLNKINHTNSPNIITSGNQLVDGTQALAYCRIRYTDGGDFERSHRHRILLNQIFEKSKTISISQYPDFLAKLLPLIHTNLEKSEIVSLTLNLNSLRNGGLLQDRFPYDEDGDGRLINGVYYYVFDEEPTIKKIHNFIYEDNT